MNTNQFDPNQLFDADYFHNCFGGIPYERSEHWVNFFRTIAARIVQDLAPQTALDAGCGIGLLVESLRDQHIDARGFDIADYALKQVPDDLQPYIQHASITDPHATADNFDLAICIEVVEHLPPQDADSAINNLCAWSNTILFSSSPSHYDEATHFNIQSPGYWVEKFARNGFFQMLDYDASYLTPWAMLFRRQTPIWPSILRRYADHAYTKSNQAHDLRQLVNTIQHTRYAHEQTLADLQEQRRQQDAAHTAELSAAQSEIDRLHTVHQSEIATLQETIHHLQQSIHTLETQHEQTIIAFQTKETERRHQLHDLQTALENARHDNTHLQTTHAALESERHHDRLLKQTTIDQLQTERDQLVSRYETTLTDLRQQMHDQRANLERAQDEHSHLLAIHDALQAELRQRISEQQSTINTTHFEQGRLIGAHGEIETRLNRQLTDLQTRLHHTEQELADTLTTYRATEAGLRAEIGAKQTTIDDLQHTLQSSIHQFQSEITDLRNQLSLAHANMSVMRGTRGWHALESWWRFKRRLFPIGSRRERLYHLFRTALETILKYGPWALISRTRRWLRNKRQSVPSPNIQPSITPPLSTNPPFTVPTLEPAQNSNDGFLFHPVADPDYAAHIRATEPTLADLAMQSAAAHQWPDPPLFSIVTPIFQPPLSIFAETLRAVQTQTYPHWQWHLVDASQNDDVWNELLAHAKNDPRLKPIRIIENLGISGNTNLALKQTTGDYIVMLDHDDTIAPHALYTIATTIRDNPHADFIYSDMDKLDEKGRRCEPLFKPDWSPVLLLCANLLCQISVFRRNLLDHVGYLDSSLDGAQDWDYYLRISEHTQNILHIPQVLYHWRKSGQSTAQHSHNKSYIKIAQIAALTNHLQRRGLTNPQVIFDDAHPIHSTYPLVTWQSQHKHRISIIIPSCDHISVLKPCLESIFKRTTYPDFQVILVDTGSTDPKTQAFYDDYADCDSFQLLRYSGDFNFSKACNLGASHADGDLLLFLNNDTVVVDGAWLDLMAQWFDLDDIGIVGPKLLYPNGKIQHAGVTLGMGALAGHVFAQESENVNTMFGTDGWYRNLLAVTGACLMISRPVFATVGGFDEDYQLNYSDIECCLRVIEYGYRIVYTPHVRLIHHESVTHGRTIPRADFERASHQWRQWLLQGDPYFNPNLTCTNATPEFRHGPHDTPANLNADLMRRLPHKPLIKLPEDVI